MLKQKIRDIKPIDFSLLEDQLHSLNDEKHRAVHDHLDKFSPDELEEIWSIVQEDTRLYAGFRALNKPEMIVLLVNNSEKWL